MMCLGRAASGSCVSQSTCKVRFIHQVNGYADNSNLARDLTKSREQERTELEGFMALPIG